MVYSLISYLILNILSPAQDDGLYLLADLPDSCKPTSSHVQEAKTSLSWFPPVHNQHGHWNIFRSRLRGPTGKAEILRYRPFCSLQALQWLLPLLCLLLPPLLPHHQLHHHHYPHQKVCTLNWLLDHSFTQSKAWAKHWWRRTYSQTCGQSHSEECALQEVPADPVEEPENVPHPCFVLRSVLGSLHHPSGLVLEKLITFKKYQKYHI